MDFTKHKRVPKIITGSLVELYPLDVQLYKIPPLSSITLNEFEELALDRVETLRIIENAALKGHKIYSEDWKACILSDLRKANLHKYVRLLQNNGSTNTENDLQARKADHISHFILRMGYCRSDELRRWFVSREMELFRIRFQNLTPDAVKYFIGVNELGYIPISQVEKKELTEDLYNCTSHMSLAQVESTDFYKVPFTEVISLVKKRRVFLKKGFAYIPSTELVTSILSIFRMELNKSLAHICHMMPELDDSRLMDILGDIHTSYSGKNYAVATDKNAVDLNDIDAFSKKSFPLCMRSLHEILRATHHLRHFGRLQYGLFLKGIGVTFEDSMRFWKDEFTKLIDGDKFEKQYAYTIKHNYGKVGRMLSYSPHGCLKIITQSIGSGDQHGCPFKTWDIINLKKKLLDYGSNNQDAQEILNLASKGHYQIACSKYFEMTNGAPSKMVINHPNQYFEESQELLNKNKK